MVIVASRLQLLHDCRPCFRCSLSAAQSYAFEMRCDIADSVGCPVVVGSEAAFAAVMALIVIGLAPLSLHCPGHAATTLVD